MTERVDVTVRTDALAGGDLERVDAHPAHDGEVVGSHLIGHGNSIANDDRHELASETDELESRHAPVLPIAGRSAASLG